MRRRSLHTIIALLLSLSVPALMHGQGQVVGPGGGVVQGTGPGWITSIQGGGQAEVTTDNPRLGWGGVGSGSLRLSVTGNVGSNGQYPDWAFWYRYAGGTAANSVLTLNSGGSFGALSQLSELSFDWFRVGMPGWDAGCGTGTQPIPPCDWLTKTPVLRLQIAETRDGVTSISELIWEGYFNQGQVGAQTPIDTWVTSGNLQQGNFWYISPNVDANGNPLYSTTGSSCGLSSFSFWQGNAGASAIEQLLGVGGCLEGSNAQVIGIAVGVGSQWPLEYLAYVDNVRMGFGGNNVLDVNFDYVVPEPATVVLVAVGLGALGLIRRRRR
jgi:hypothetical protein